MSLATLKNNIDKTNKTPQYLSPEEMMDAYINGYADQMLPTTVKGNGYVPTADLNQPYRDAQNGKTPDVIPSASSLYNDYLLQNPTAPVSSIVPTTTGNGAGAGAGAGAGNGGGSLGGGTTGGGTGGTTAADTATDAANDDKSVTDRWLELVNGLPTYQPSYDAQLNALYDKIVNRDPFSYDLNADMLYQQYKDQYVNLGQLAMRNAMGQAAALTGGYGSSYGQAVGQQQYDAYLQQLHDKVPELWDRAYSLWKGEGDNLLTQYSLLSQRAQDEYNRYQDELANYWKNLNFNSDQYWNELNFGADQYWKGLSYDKDLEDSDWEKQKWLYSKGLPNSIVPTDTAAAAGTTGGYTGGGYNNGSLTADQVKQLQGLMGLNPDGMYGPNTTAAFGGLTADQAWDKYGGGTPGDGDGKTGGYTTSELLQAFGNDGMTKAQVEEVLRNRGVNVNDPAVQADIKWAMSK